MMRVYPPRARFRFRKCVTWPCVLDGKISVTRNSALAARRSGSKRREAVRVRVDKGRKIQRFTDSARTTNMQILTTIAEAHAQPHARRRVLVPTMGALHKAHGKMVRLAREHAGHDGEVALSI